MPKRRLEHAKYVKYSTLRTQVNDLFSGIVTKILNVVYISFPPHVLRAPLTAPFFP
jgi:hypothetical protein